MDSFVSKPRFSTILSRRGKDNRPSDLALELQPHCQRLIVKSTPLSGAHLLITSERIAIRAYYFTDLQELWDQEQEKRQSKSQKTSHETSPSNPNKNDDDDFDGLSAFFSSFQVALVFFIMPLIHDEDEIHDPMIEQLDEIDSYFQKAQRLSIRHQREAEAALPTNTKSKGASTKNSCVMLLPDIQSTIQSLMAIADSLLPERKANKKAFLQQLQAKFFIPPSLKENANVASLPSMTEIVDPDVVASHVAKGLFEMAETFELPSREVEILMSELGDLKTIATADDSVLERIPIHPRTRKVLHSFFGSSEGRKGYHGEPIYLEESAKLQQRQANEEHPNALNHTVFASRQPPQSNSSFSRNSHAPPLERSEHSNRHPFQVRRQLPPSKRQDCRRFDSSDAEEAWMQQDDGHFDSFDHDDDGIPEEEYNFHVSNNELENISDGAPHFSKMAPMQAPSLLRRDQGFGSHRHDPGFPSNHSSSMHPSDMNPSAFSRNENYDNFSRSGQSLNGGIWSRREPMSQRYNDSSHRNVQQRYHAEQPAYDRSQHSNVEDGRNNFASNSRQYGRSDLPVSSHWQRDYQPQHRYQNQNYHKRAFRR